MRKIMYEERLGVYDLNLDNLYFPLENREMRTYYRKDHIHKLKMIPSDSKSFSIVYPFATYYFNNENIKNIYPKKNKCTK